MGFSGGIEEKKAAKKSYYAAWYVANRTRVRARQAEAYKSSPDAAKARTAAWYAQNKERALKYHAERKKASPQKSMWREARKRAKWKGIEFAIKESDINIPAICPVLGIALSPGSGVCHDGSPTVDRIDSTKGYTPANIVVISSRANRIKNNSTLEELRMLVRFLEGVSG